MDGLLLSSLQAQLFDSSGVFFRIGAPVLLVLAGIWGFGQLINMLAADKKDNRFKYARDARREARAAARQFKSDLRVTQRYNDRNNRK